MDQPYKIDPQCLHCGFIFYGFINNCRTLIFYMQSIVPPHFTIYRVFQKTYAKLSLMIYFLKIRQNLYDHRFDKASFLRLGTTGFEILNILQFFSNNFKVALGSFIKHGIHKCLETAHIFMVKLLAVYQRHADYVLIQ